MLSLQLFGPPQISLDGKPVPVERRKSRALIYYLAANAQPIPRDALIAQFWAGMERSAAQQVLRTTLHGLRRALGDWLVSDRDLIGLDENVRVDARTFEHSLRLVASDVAGLAFILNLYRGAFLEGFSLYDSVEFDNWQVVERERYQRLAMRGFSSLSRLYAQQHEYQPALAVLERALALDPLQEDLQRETIRLSYLAGDRAGAIRRYDSLRRLLDDELGVPPMQETRALYDDILADRLPPLPEQPPMPIISTKPARLAAANPSSGSMVLPFLSREAELRRLRENLFSGKLLLVEGEPGIGKTRLVNEFLAGQSLLTLTGSAYELEQTLPYHPVIEALRGLAVRPDWTLLRGSLLANLPAIWAQETARLLPELGAPSDSLASADEWRLWEGVNQFLQAAARQQPVALFLDDLHWADASTLRLLGYLLRQSASPGRQPIGFIAATRSYSRRSAMAELIHTLTRAGLVERIRLQRFSSNEIAALASQISAVHADELSSWLDSITEGNPFILTEMLRAARQQDLLPAAGTEVDLHRLKDVDILPHSIFSLIQSRLARLSEPARRILDAAVVIGRDFSFEVAARAAVLSEDAALDSMDELLASGLITETQPAGYRFDHSLTMEVAYRETGELRHRRMHRQVAEAMEAVYPRGRLESLAGKMAFHFTEGCDQRRAAPYAVQAGRQAASLAAWQEAAAFFEMALDGLDGKARLPVLMELGQAYNRLAAAARAVETFRLALGLAEAAHQDDLVDQARLALAQALLPLARYGESITELHKVLADGRKESAFQAELWLGTVLSVEGAELETAAQYLHQAEAHCSLQTTPINLSHVKFELGSVEAQRGNLLQAVQHYRDALAAALQAPLKDSVERRILAYNNLAYHLHLLADPSAVEYARAGMELAKEWGVLYLQTYLYSTQGEIAQAAGDLQQAQASFDAGLELARQLAIPERIAGLTANLGQLAAARGEPSLAIHLLSAAMSQADALGLRQLSAQVRIWLSPLLPVQQARMMLAEGRALAGTERHKLLEAIAAAEKELKII